MKKSSQSLLNLNRLHNICNASKPQLTKGYDRIERNKRACWFKDNGGDILAVAHIDHVCQDNHFGHVKLGDDILVYSPRLDDRLGVYTITDVLPRIGIRADILLCDDEEMGQSTASLFDTDKKYNWMVEFDRSGDDAVLYQYRNNADWLGATRSFFEIDYGSYSDISRLDHLGVCGINIGVGYHEYHGPRAHFSVDEWYRNLCNFAGFYDQFKDARFEHKASRYNELDDWPYDYAYKKTKSRNNTGYIDAYCPYCYEETLFESGHYPNSFRCNSCGELVPDTKAIPVLKNELPF